MLLDMGLAWAVCIITVPYVCQMVGASGWCGVSQVMVATATGVVATVYEGGAQRCRAGGLKPGAEYIFMVKATYDDGSAAWSAPRAFHTRT